MLQLKVPFSKYEAEVLVGCLSALEAKQQNAVVQNPSATRRDIAPLVSAKKKVKSNVFDDFHHDEITHMIYALDSLSRECNNQLTENTPIDTAREISTTLRTAASARSKLRRAITSD